MHVCFLRQQNVNKSSMRNLQVKWDPNRYWNCCVDEGQKFEVKDIFGKKDKMMTTKQTEISEKMLLMEKTVKFCVLQD